MHSLYNLILQNCVATENMKAASDDIKLHLSNKFCVFPSTKTFLKLTYSQQPCEVLRTNESVSIRKWFNSHRISLWTPTWLPWRHTVTLYCKIWKLPPTLRRWKNHSFISNDFSILYLHKSHNTPLLPSPPSPPQFCITIVCNFSWDLNMTIRQCQCTFWGGSKRCVMGFFASRECTYVRFICYFFVSSQSLTQVTTRFTFPTSVLATCHSPIFHHEVVVLPCASGWRQHTVAFSSNTL